MQLVYREVIELGLNTEDATEDIHGRRLCHTFYPELQTMRFSWTYSGGMKATLLLQRRVIRSS